MNANSIIYGAVDPLTFYKEEARLLALEERARKKWQETKSQSAFLAYATAKASRIVHQRTY